MSKEETKKESMWKTYEVELHFTSPFAASTPKNMKDIVAMLEARQPDKKPENATPLPELAEQVAGEVGYATLLAMQLTEEVGASEEVERGYATFKFDDKGLYYEARCVRAHMKDCANILQGLLGIKALKSKFANRCYVFPEKIYLGRKAVDGSETRIIHAMTMKGPRSSFKTIDYLLNADLKFKLKVMDDGVIGEDILKAIFEYGGVHGMGQERGSGDFGKYDLVKLEEVS